MEAFQASGRPSILRHLKEGSRRRHRIWQRSLAPLCPGLLQRLVGPRDEEIGSVGHHIPSAFASIRRPLGGVGTLERVLVAYDLH